MLSADRRCRQFEDFLATLTFPPNPFRNLDNTLPTQPAAAGALHHRPLRPRGPAPAQRQRRQWASHLPPAAAAARRAGWPAATCHTLPTGLGTDMPWDGARYHPLPVGPAGRAPPRPRAPTTASPASPSRCRSCATSTRRSAWSSPRRRARTGFGFLHDGSWTRSSRFVSQPAFAVPNDQEVADLVAFVLAFSARTCRRARPPSLLEPPGARQQGHARRRGPAGDAHQRLPRGRPARAHQRLPLVGRPGQGGGGGEGPPGRTGERLRLSGRRASSSPAARSRW